MNKLDDIRQYREDEIKIGEPTRRIYLQVSDAVALLMVDNPKVHDFGAIATSIMRFGFQDPPKYDATLGAIKDGNGRTVVLSLLEDDGRFDPPPGIGRDEDGAWVMPILIGVDASDPDEALAYSVDANTLNLSGSGMSPIDAAMMFDPELYHDLIEHLAEQGKTPVSIGDDYVDLLLDVLEKLTETWEEGTPDFSNLTRCPACGHYWTNEVDEEDEKMLRELEEEDDPMDHLSITVSPI